MSEESQYSAATRLLNKHLPIDAYWVDHPPLAAIRQHCRMFFNWGVEWARANEDTAKKQPLGKKNDEI